MLFPKFNHGKRGRWGGCCRSIDQAHVILCEKLNGLRRDGPMAGVAIFRAEPVRALHALRHTVYNLRDVITDMESVRGFVHITALVSFASVTESPLGGCYVLIAHNSPIVDQNAITMQWYRGNIS